MVIFRASGGTGKHSADNIRILHCIAPQGRKFWFLGGFSTFLFIFAISHAYFLMFSYIILIYLCKLPYFTYHLGRGGPPRPKVQILDLFKTRYFSTIFFLYDLWFESYDIHSFFFQQKCWIFWKNPTVDLGIFGKSQWSNGIFGKIQRSLKRLKITMINSLPRHWVGKA